MRKKESERTKAFFLRAVTKYQANKQKFIHMSARHQNHIFPPNVFEVIRSNTNNPPCCEADCCVSDETRNFTLLVRNQMFDESYIESSLV